MSENEIKPVAWMCDAGDGENCDATNREFVRADYASFGRKITPLYPQSAIDRLTAERDAATAIAQAFEEAKALAADRDPARLVAYDWIESRAAMIFATRAQESKA